MMKSINAVKTASPMRKIIMLGMFVSGIVAAYLMYRRGESIPSIAKQTVTNPVGSLVTEVKNAV
jgi:hypothetical protein